MADIRDPRVPERRIYQTRFLMWMGLLLFVLKLGARRRRESLRPYLIGDDALDLTPAARVPIRLDSS